MRARETMFNSLMGDLLMYFNASQQIQIKILQTVILYVTYLFLLILGVLFHISDSSDILILMGILVSFCKYNHLAALLCEDVDINKDIVNSNK